MRFNSLAFLGYVIISCMIYVKLRQRMFYLSQRNICLLLTLIKCYIISVYICFFMMYCLCNVFMYDSKKRTVMFTEGGWKSTFDSSMLVTESIHILILDGLSW